MDVVLVLERIVHIVASILWVGAAALLYAEPPMNPSGQESDTFVDIPTYFGITSTISVVGGALLYWSDSNGLQLSWVTSPRGLVFGLGGLAAIVVWFVGNFVIPRIIAQHIATSGQLRAAGGLPRPDLINRLHRIQGRLRTIGQVEIVILVVAVVAMAIGPELAS